MEKIYYQLLFTQKSPLRIGNAYSGSSDSDLMLDGRGMPFIPGTSLAGVIRHTAERICKEETILNELFGNIVPEKGGKKEEIISSSVIVGDAVLSKNILKDNVVIGKRDGVGLGEWETAIKSSKFDFQIAESEQEYCAIVEWTGDEEKKKKEIEQILDPIMEHMSAAGISIGARTSRGYGDFKVKVKKISFSFPQDLTAWLNFKPYEENAFEKAKVISGTAINYMTEVKIDFVMTGSFSVRVNTAKTELAEDGSVPDSIPMKNHHGNPVIPGTVWAGVFRHHMHHLLRDTGVSENSPQMQRLDTFFGKGITEKENKKSKLSFSETEITGGTMTSVVRNAIERFTATPRKGALFTSSICTGGKGTLCIRFEKDNVEDDIRELLAACISDMHVGLITVGGEASVGRGTMRITGIKVNGQDKFSTEDELESLLGELNWLKEKKTDE